MQTYTREKCRFPAFDDDQGVKLTTMSQRVLFDGNDDLITNHRLEAKDVFGRELPKPKRNRRVALDDEPRRELNQHKANLPKETTKTTFSTTTGRSATPFAPTFVPSSLIPDQDPNAISPRELMQRMEKQRNSYILFAPEKKVEKPAIERKNSRQRLDRSLRGIMEEDNSKIENSKYFQE